jgi:putative transcriptional regulator
MPALPAEISSEPVLLVAKPALRDRLYGSTILIASPFGNGRHVGLIVNRPTPVTLGKLFPDHAPSRKVTEPVYLGGPVGPELLFALVKRRDSPGARSLRMSSDLYLVFERNLVDRIIETESRRARFYAGMVLWSPGELRSEIERGFWYVQEADSRLVLRKSTAGMWEELVRRLQREERSPPPRGIRTGF